MLLQECVKNKLEFFINIFIDHEKIRIKSLTFFATVSFSIYTIFPAYWKLRDAFFKKHFELVRKPVFPCSFCFFKSFPCNASFKSTNKTQSQGEKSGL